MAVQSVVNDENNGGGMGHQRTLTTRDNKMKTGILCHHKEIPQAKDSISLEPNKNTLRLLAKLETDFVAFVNAECKVLGSVSKIKEYSLREAKQEKNNSESLKSVSRDFKWCIKELERSHKRIMTHLNELCSMLCTMRV